MKYLSLFSGIEAASVAWEPLGFTPVAFSEIEPFPCAVLSHHFPDVPNLGDANDFREWPDLDVDLVVGGSPCQSFSVAGNRLGLADARGNLALVYMQIVERYRPKWVLWENVPGALSADRGRAFSAIIGALEKLGYALAWRVLDAQYIRVDGFPRAVPQRRRRVFLVGYSGARCQCAAQVLFDRASLPGDPPPHRTQPHGHAPSSAGSSGEYGQITYDTLIQNVTGTLQACFAKKQGLENQHVRSGMPMFIPVCFNARQTPCTYGNTAGTLNSGPPQDMAVYSVHESERAEVRLSEGVSGALTCGGGKIGQGYQAALIERAIRRITPREAERLQGFPDDWTLVPYRGRMACDTPRYKALGNSMAVNAMRRLGTRIQQIERKNSGDEPERDRG